MREETHFLRIVGENEKDRLAREHGFSDEKPEAKDKSLNELSGLLRLINVVLAEHLFNSDQQPNDLGVQFYWRGTSECIVLYTRFYEDESLQDALMFTTAYEGKRALVHLEHNLRQVTDYQIKRLIS
jgi:hypothetical protein